MTVHGSYASGFAPRDGQPLYPELWRGCVGAWAPCLGPTGLTLRDWSGCGNHGTLINMDAYSDWVINSGRHSLDFDGVNDYVNAAEASQWHKADCSFACWACYRGNGNAGYGAVLSRDNGSNQWIFLSRDNASFGGRLSLNLYDGSNNPCVLSSTVLSLGVLYHLGFSIRGNTATVYINGKADGSASISNWTRPTLTGVQLGRWGASGGGRAMDGFLFDCMLYSRGLSASEFGVASRRMGIAYDLATRRISRSFAGGFKAYWAAKRAQIIGGGL